jgi:two-component system phosphate regulon response regulator PhoB
MQINLEPHVTSLQLPRADRQTVLVIEDNPSALDTMTLALRKEGYQVRVARDQQQALQVLDADLERSQPSINLVILDQDLQQGRGLDLCWRIRHRTKSIPLLMISNSSAEDDVVKGLEFGADHYLSKPFGTRELIARTRALLRFYQTTQTTTTSANRTLTYRNLALSPDEHRVTKHGQEVILTPKEYQLLETLMRHPRQVLSCEQLLHQVWGDDFWGDSKTVNVHISWLRKKLESKRVFEKFWEVKFYANRLTMIRIIAR